MLLLQSNACLCRFFPVQRIVLGVWVRGGFRRVFGGGFGGGGGFGEGWGHESVCVRMIFFW